MSEHAFRVCYPIIVSFINENEFALGLGLVNHVLSSKKKHCTNTLPHGVIEKVEDDRLQIIEYVQGSIKKRTTYREGARDIPKVVLEYSSPPQDEIISTMYHNNGQIYTKSRYTSLHEYVGLQESWHQNGQIESVVRYTTTAPSFLTGLFERWYPDGTPYMVKHYGEQQGTYGKCVGRHEIRIYNQWCYVFNYGTTVQTAGKQMGDQYVYGAFGQCLRHDVYGNTPTTAGVRAFSIFL
jgi:hypothetical protein